MYENVKLMVQEDEISFTKRGTAPYVKGEMKMSSSKGTDIEYQMLRLRGRTIDRIKGI